MVIIRHEFETMVNFETKSHCQYHLPSYERKCQNNMAGVLSEEETAYPSLAHEFPHGFIVCIVLLCVFKFFRYLLWCPLWFPHQTWCLVRLYRQLFVEKFIYAICVCMHIVMDQHQLCCVFVLFVFFLLSVSLDCRDPLPLWNCLTFISRRCWNLPIDIYAFKPA